MNKKHELMCREKEIFDLVYRGTTMAEKHWLRWHEYGNIHFELRWVINPRHFLGIFQGFPRLKISSFLYFYLCNFVNLTFHALLPEKNDQYLFQIQLPTFCNRWHYSRSLLSWISLTFSHYYSISPLLLSLRTFRQRKIIFFYWIFNENGRKCDNEPICYINLIKTFEMSSQVNSK